MSTAAPSRRDWIHRARRGSQIAAIAALAIGGVELAVWIWQPPWVDRASPLYFMKVNSALAVVALACGSLAVAGNEAPWRRWAATAAAATVLAITTLTLVEYAAGISVGVDELLAADHTVDRGRMAAQSAATLTFASLALLTISARTGAAALASNVMLVAAWVTLELMIIGFFDRATLLYDVTGQSPAAPQSAIAQVLAVAAIAFGRAALGGLPVLTGTSRGSVAVRMILPWIIVLPFGLGQLRAAGEAAGLFTAPYGHTLFAAVQTLILGGSVYGFARSMNRLDERYRRERQQREEYERYVAVCAWSRRVKWQDRWLSVEDFLRQRFNLEVSHGISDEALAAQLAEFEADRDADAASHV